MRRKRAAFTLLELVVTVGVIATLAGLLLAGARGASEAAKAAECLHGLRQLGLATTLYLSENNQTFFPYKKLTPEGTFWYFGLESGSNWTSGDGNRNLDPGKSPLAPYLSQAGGVEICGAFDYGSALWKPKFKGASWGYGYNCGLGGGPLGSRPLVSILQLSRPASVVVFGDCAQANDFQAPASPTKPMLEEFYILDDFHPHMGAYRTIHFRHRGLANFVFADGHVEPLPMAPGTQDMRIPDAQIGRITPVGSMEHLQ